MGERSIKRRNQTNDQHIQKLSNEMKMKRANKGAEEKAIINTILYFEGKITWGEAREVFL